jgi:hypothetical protein
MIFDSDLWFKTLQSAAMFSLFCFTDRVNAEGQAVLIEIGLRSIAKSAAVFSSRHATQMVKRKRSRWRWTLRWISNLPLATCDTFHRQIWRSVFAGFTVDWAVRF